MRMRPDGQFWFRKGGGGGGGGSCGTTKSCGYDSDLDQINFYFYFI